MNMIGYVKENQKTMKEVPFSEVDSLVLSQLAYLYYSHFGMRSLLKEIASNDDIDQLLGNNRGDSDNVALVRAVAKSRRFQNIAFDFYQEKFSSKHENQFAAITFLLEDGSNYLAFRGTDGTLVGWKEDFNMAFIYPVLAQEEALAYVEKVSQRVNGRLYLGGHSKGGNLAVYAGCRVSDDLKKRIISIYSHDGPGFSAKFLLETDFSLVKDKIKKQVPESSLIGMLLYTQENYEIVKSNAYFLLQHDPFSWEIEENAFVVLEKLSDGSKYTNQVLHDWLDHLNEDERKHFVTTLFDIIDATGAKTFEEFAKVWKSKIPAMIKKASQVDEKSRRYLWEVIKTLIAMALKNIPYAL